MAKIGFFDKNGRDIRHGDKVVTKDSKGKTWVGSIVLVDQRGVIRSPVVEAGGIQYAFQSNYGTWINDQGYASELEIL